MFEQFGKKESGEGTTLVFCHSRDGYEKTLTLESNSTNPADAI